MHVASFSLVSCAWTVVAAAVIACVVDVSSFVCVASTPVTLLYHVSLETQGSYHTVKFQEQSTSITQRLSLGVATPQRSSRSATVRAASLILL